MLRHGVHKALLPFVVVGNRAGVEAHLLRGRGRGRGRVRVRVRARVGVRVRARVGSRVSVSVC